MLFGTTALLRIFHRHRMYDGIDWRLQIHGRNDLSLSVALSANRSALVLFSTRLPGHRDGVVRCRRLVLAGSTVTVM